MERTLKSKLPYSSSGCNDLTIFQSAEDAELVELGSKLLLHYHGKACRDGICLDLAASHLYNGRLKGPNCVTYDLKVSQHLFDYVCRLY